MRFFVGLDDALLHIADRFVQWMWYRFEVPHQMIVRISLVLWGGFYFIADSLGKTPHNVIANLLIFVLLLGTSVLRSRRNQKTDDDTYNAGLAITRCWPVQRVSRVLLFTLFTASMILDGVAFVLQPGQYAALFACVLVRFLASSTFIYTDDALRPKGPPRRKNKKFVTKLAFGGAS